MLAIVILWPLIATAKTISSAVAPLFIESTSTSDYALVASSIPQALSPRELVMLEFQDAPVMFDIADAESSFNPSAKNASSTATGIFQILKGTWKSYDCSGVRTNASDNIACARKIYDDSGTRPWNSSKNKWGT